MVTVIIKYIKWGLSVVNPEQNIDVKILCFVSVSSICVKL